MIGFYHRLSVYMDPVSSSRFQQIGITDGCSVIILGTGDGLNSDFNVKSTSVYSQENSILGLPQKTSRCLLPCMSQQWNH